MFGRPCNTVHIALYLREGLVTPAEVRWLCDHTIHVTSQANTSELTVEQPILLVMRVIRDELFLVVGSDRNPLSPSTPPGSNDGSEARSRLERHHGSMSNTNCSGIERHGVSAVSMIYPNQDGLRHSNRFCQDGQQKPSPRLESQSHEPPIPQRL